MKCMNPEGLMVENMLKTHSFDIAMTPQIRAEFKERVEIMLKYYKESKDFQIIKPSTDLVLPQNNDYLNKVRWFTQYHLVTQRALLNEFRNPLDLRTKFVSSIIYAIFLLCAFYGVLYY